MKNKDFSVVMCVYKSDNPEYFKRAIESVLDATVPPSEVVLVVDGPVFENLDESIKQFEGRPDLKVIRLEENVGFGNALKIAIENCNYELIARMDSDDVSLPDRFEKQLKFFEEDEELDILSGDISEFIDDEENIVSKRELPVSDKEIKNYMKTRCAINHVAVMYKKSSVLKAGGYVEIFCNEDYYLWIRMMLAGCRFANTGDVLVNVRVGNDMYKRRGGIRYFKSEYFIQKYMYKNKIIGFATFASNVIKRFVVQLLLPNFLRKWIFVIFARTK